MTPGAAAHAPATTPPAPARTLGLAPDARGPEPSRPPLRLWAGRPAAAGAVRRPRLVRLLADPAGPPLALLTAPAGYGKTTLLREWEAADARPFAWVSPPRGDDDPDRLAAALGAAIGALGRARPDGPFVLVADDVHATGGRRALETLAAVAEELPPGARLALASRVEPELPLARLRAQALVLELGPHELAMTRPEAARLFEAGGRRLDPDGIATALRRTEGWPAGLALAALHLGDDLPGSALARFGGDDRLVGRYVREEVLAGLTPDEARFLLCTAACDTLTAPLCDWVLRRVRSAATLDRLARSGLLVAVDRAEERFRHPTLLGEALRAELARTEPGLARELHRRAADWHRRAGDDDRAIRHALAAGEAATAADVVAAQAAASIAAGGLAQVERRLGWFTDAQRAEDPRLALLTAGCRLARGRGDLVDHWVHVAAAAGAAGDPGTAAGVALLRGALARAGTRRMGDDALAGGGALPADGPARAFGDLVAGLACHLRGERAAAVRLLGDGARRAAVAAPGIQALCLAQLALDALEHDDAEHAAGLSARARAQIERHALRDTAPAALVLAVSGLVRARRGAIDAAREDVEEASRRVAALVDYPPWFEVEVRLTLARAALRLGDAAGARRRVAECERIVARAEDAGVLPARVSAVRDEVDARAAHSSAASCLTPAELRILRLLPSHFSFREIAAGTRVSLSTVKTQANAIYRKLGVRSRSEAVARARACGLLGD